MMALLLEGESDSNLVRFVMVRKQLISQLDSGKYPYRLSVVWHYDGDAAGMPDDETAAEMERLHDACVPALERNNLALLAYTLTGEGAREWCFYTRNLAAFNTTFNASLAALPLYPLTFEAEEDRTAADFRELHTLASASEELAEP